MSPAETSNLVMVSGGLQRRRSLVRQVVMGLVDGRAGRIAVRRLCVLGAAALLGVTGVGCTGGGGPTPTSPRLSVMSSSVTPGVNQPALTTRADRAVPLCERRDLDARYVAGGAGGQTLFGNIVIRNLGSGPCTITGRPHLAANLTNGEQDREAADQRGLPVVSALMPADTPALIDGRSPQNYLQDLIGAPMFPCNDHNPANYHYIAPAWFVLTIGHLSFRVRNLDTESRASQRVLAGCGGAVILEHTLAPNS
jgi:hypothetical protein